MSIDSSSLALLPSSEPVSHSNLTNELAAHAMVHVAGNMFSPSLDNASSCCSASATTWIVDTGATDHMVSSVSVLTSITSIVTSSVKMPNNNFASVTHIGIVLLSYIAWDYPLRITIACMNIYYLW